MSLSPILAMNEVAVGYDGKNVVEDVSISLQRGEIGALLGASGSGKSSLLRAIAGLEPVTAGRISIDANEVSTLAVSVAPERRNVAMMFQDLALFPHLNVAQNIAFPLRDMSSNDKDRRVRELLSLVGLDGREMEPVQALSGGQQQRVALARAMAKRPKLLLLDEPFSSLDKSLRESLALEIRRILKSADIAALLVTHDHHEAFAMSDNVGVLHQMQLLQWASPFQLYHQPRHRYVAEFVGQGAFINGLAKGASVLETVFGDIEVDSRVSLDKSARWQLLLRPDDVVFDENSNVQGTVVEKAFQGSHFSYRVALTSGEKITVIAPSDNQYAVGSMVGVSVHLNHRICFATSDQT